MAFRVRLAGGLWGPLDGRLEALQTQFGSSDSQKLEVARALLLGKAANSQWTLRRLGLPAVLNTEGLQRATSAEELRGHEGHLAWEYFGVWKDAVDGWGLQAACTGPPQTR